MFFLSHKFLEFWQNFWQFATYKDEKQKKNSHFFKVIYLFVFSKEFYLWVLAFLVLKELKNHS